MVKLLVVVLLLSLLIYAATAWDAEGFFNFKSCSPNRCSKHGPEVRFPLRLSLQSPSCGTPLLELSCSGQDIILYHQVLGSCKVTEISYKNASMTVSPLVDSTPHCPLQKLILANLSTDAYKPQTLGAASLVSCSTDSIPRNNHGIVGPISCFSNNGSQWYLVHPYASMSVLQPDCTVVCKGIHSPSTYKETEDGVIGVNKLVFTWDSSNITRDCQKCENEGRHCGFSSRKGRAFCHYGSYVITIAAPSVAIIVVLLLIVATALYLFLKPQYDEEVHLKVEMFLKTYGTSKPKSVYKGDLPNGVPVAVKMLENFIGDGQEFINEVATIGTIHHANVLRLLGFCSEGTRCALIYEFMPNDSLDKYIFSQGSDVSRDFLVPAKMVDIALGIARGMEYLHQGCNQRILHFDIKPHNILLDYRFNPKISDFRLAKLCARDQSIVTLTAARGTKGYIAPELYSRNFGAISYKSDVYSFGMLVIEMVSGRRNLDPNIETQDEVYFPKWIYENLFTGQHLTIGMEMTQDEKDRVRQLAIVALWCVQWNPKNRPSTTQVVNMLTGRLQDLQMPPKPFVSSTSNSMQ